MDAAPSRILFWARGAIVDPWGLDWWELMAVYVRGASASAQCIAKAYGPEWIVAYGYERSRRGRHEALLTLGSQCLGSPGAPGVMPSSLHPGATGLTCACPVSPLADVNKEASGRCSRCHSVLPVGQLLCRLHRVQEAALAACVGHLSQARSVMPSGCMGIGER